MTSFTGEEGVNSDKFATAYCDITPVSGIGLNPDVSDPILYLNRSAILFIIGKYIAVQNLQTKEVCLLDPNVETNCSLGEITAFTLCPKRKYLAVCRSNNARTDSTSVFIYNVKEKKKRSSQEVHNKQAFLRGHELLRVLKMAYERIVSIAFSTDSNLICCQSNNASWTFTIWDWSRSREIATADAYYKVDRIRFNVVDVAQISSSGGNLLRVWSLSEYTLKTFATFKTSEDGKQKQCSNYVDHVWLPDDCLVALQEDGDVKLIVNAELVQVIRSIHSPRMVSAIDSLWNGEGVVVGGAEGYISIIRVEMKSIKSYEKEMHVQRRIKVHENTILSLAVDPFTGIFMCCTERSYGYVDPSNLFIMRSDEETIALSNYSGSMICSSMGPLSGAPRRSTVLSQCVSRSGECFINIWSQKNLSQSPISLKLDSEPLSVDFHPSGLEMLISFQNKTQILWLLHDVLRPIFEISLKQVTLAKYNSSGSAFVLVHVSRLLYVYKNYDREDSQPMLLGTINQGGDVISCITWEPNGSNLFFLNLSGELGKYQFNVWGSSDGYFVLGIPKTKGNLFFDLATCVVRDSRIRFVLFAVEQIKIPNSYKSAVRIWLNGEISYENNESDVFLVDKAVTIEVSSDRTIIIGTEQGAVLITQWKLETQEDPSNECKLVISPIFHRIDLHRNAIKSLYYNMGTKQLFCNSNDGTLIACYLTKRRESGKADQLSIRDLKETCISTVITLANGEDSTLLDRSFIDSSKARLFELESEIQQLRVQNEKIAEGAEEYQKASEERRVGELASVEKAARKKEIELQGNTHALVEQLRLHREYELKTIGESSQILQEGHLRRIEDLSHQLNQAYEEIRSLKVLIEELQKLKHHQNIDTENQIKVAIQEEKTRNAAHEENLLKQLEAAKLQIKEILRQNEEDSILQTSMLSASIEQERAKSQEHLSLTNGKTAALHQEIKILLSALHQKEKEISSLKTLLGEQQTQISRLENEVQQEIEISRRVSREKNDSLNLFLEQKASLRSLQRMNSVHRSQIDLLQKQLIPRERELEKVNDFVTEAHKINQSIVLQANLSDRLRKASSAQALQNAKQNSEIKIRLEQLQRSLFALHEDLSDIVKRSAQMEKPSLITEILRVHKNLEDLMEHQHDGHLQLTEELHRQNNFLQRHKKYLERQINAEKKEKHQLISALTLQNTSLISELNTLRMKQRDLERNAIKANVSKTMTFQFIDSGSKILKPLTDHRYAIDGSPKNNATVSTDIIISHPHLSMPRVTKDTDTENNSISPRTRIRPKSAIGDRQQRGRCG